MQFTIVISCALLFALSVTAEDPYERLGTSDAVIREWLEDQRSHKASVYAEDTYVTIKDGILKGTTYTAIGGKTIYAYLGIPYAKPPVGELRLENPQPFEDSWGDEVRDATLHPNACPQFLTNTTIADEDCLYVSVYSTRNNESTGELLPVMYFIHGGGFILGQTSYYTGSKLLAEDVVLVTVQYRLGPLGFASMLDKDLSGNYGMKDMVMGLRWVQENIEAFGGDPNRVTVFGESAGAASAIYLMLAPSARGLFHQAAAISGTAIAEWAVDRDPIDSSRRLAEELDCPANNGKEFKECLKSLDWQTISQAHFTMLLSSLGSQLRINLAGTSPVIEPEDAEEPFLTQEPLALLQAGNYSRVPLLLGANQHEGSFIIAAAYILKLGHDGLLEDPHYVHDNLFGELLATWGVDESVNGASISQGLAAGWVHPENPRTNFSTFQYELIDLSSVLFMKAPILRTAEIVSRNEDSPVYFYSFEHASRNSLYNFLQLIPLIEPFLPPEFPEIPIPDFKGGITHADDLIYMYSLPVIPTPVDREFSKVWCKFFTNFATDGQPAKEPDADGRYPQWPNYVEENPQYMRVAANPEVKTHYPLSWRQGMTYPEQ